MTERIEIIPLTPKTMLSPPRPLLCMHPTATRTVLASELVRWVNGTHTFVSYQCGRCARLSTTELAGRFTTQQVQAAWRGDTISKGATPGC